MRGAHLLHGTVSDKVGEVEGVGAGTPGGTTNTNTGEPAKNKVGVNTLQPYLLFFQSNPKVFSSFQVFLSPIGSYPAWSPEAHFDKSASGLGIVKSSDLFLSNSGVWHPLELCVRKVYTQLVAKVGL